MTLKRLMIILGILVVLAGVGIAWLWQYAYSPQGRARVIIAQLKNDTTSLRGWMLQHHVIRPGFSEPPPNEGGFGHIIDRDKAAADEMEKLGHDVLPIVIDAFQDENDHDMVCMAIRVCGKFHDPSAIKPLVKCMHDITRDHPTFPGDESPFFNFEEQCMGLLIESGPESFGFLLDVSKECKYDFRRRSLYSLSEMWGAAAIPHLIELLKDSDWLVRDGAASQLGEFKDNRATDALIGCLSNSDRDLRASAAKALGDVGDHKAIPQLLKVLQKKEHPRNECFEDHISAAAALARMGRDEGLHYLRPLLNSPRCVYRIDVADVIGHAEIPGALEMLLSLLSDKEDLVRSSAATSLGNLGDPRAIPALRKLLNDTDWMVNDRAYRALDKLGVKPPPASQPGKP